ncbi:MAG TPA: hypothetical protein VMY41_14790 [Thermohalobaculum sp.]|nr:hypothetical protein [Thermohalobaculum sp.]
MAIALFPGEDHQSGYRASDRSDVRKLRHVSDQFRRLRARKHNIDCPGNHNRAYQAVDNHPSLFPFGIVGLSTRLVELADQIAERNFTRLLKSVL